MKIEVGKFYKTRDEQKVEILAIRLDTYQPVKAMFIPTGTLRSWGIDGSYEFGGPNSPYDLVSEWEEPKSRLLAYMRCDGYIRFMTKETHSDYLDFVRVPHLDLPEDAND